MIKFELQEILFAKVPDFGNLLKLATIDNPNNARLNVNVWRNHGFEPLVPLMAPYFLFGNISCSFKISDYDDSLTFADWTVANLELIWLDINRISNKLKKQEIAGWIVKRVGFLRAKTTAPIVLATWFQDSTIAKEIKEKITDCPGTFILDLEEVVAELDIDLVNIRTEKLTGTPINKNAFTIIARELACRSIPGAIIPPLKAIAVDLDNTLHFGILGEDGPRGVRLYAEHMAFQSYLKSLKEKGVFLSLISRNESLDVKELFSTRSDYPLSWDDFTTTEINWDEKSNNILKTAEKLNISTNAIIFIDDNPGELANVASRISTIHCIYAHQDPFITLNTLKYYPGLWRWNIREDDLKRIQDLKANFQRQALSSQSLTEEDYFLELKTCLNFHENEIKQSGRLSDLSNKTNQFNMSMQRLNENQIIQLISDPSYEVISTGLNDMLSDSGIISLIVGRKCNDTLSILEICISCRAMGRKLENPIIIESIKKMGAQFSSKYVEFHPVQGPRNQPALEWLRNILKLEDTPQEKVYKIPFEKILETKPIAGLSIKWS